MNPRSISAIIDLLIYQRKSPRGGFFYYRALIRPHLAHLKNIVNSLITIYMILVSVIMDTKALFDF